MDYDIKDISFADKGKLRIEWAEQQMDVLRNIKERFAKEKPLSGLTVGACLHVTTETANLAITLKEGGASVYLCASNPLSTQDDAAASLVKHYEIPVFAIKGEDEKTYYSHISSVLDNKPGVTMDDGADLISVLHSERKDQAGTLIGGTEETTTGVIRLVSMAKNGVLLFPIVAVNEAKTKHFFDNRYGTGQSTIDGILRATNILFAGKVFVVFGYGWCGRGVAMRARGMGASVVVCEVDPLNALEAKMDGYMVMDSISASKIGDVFVTVTGNLNVVGKKHFENMKDGAILANSGHFNVEIDIPALENMSSSKRTVRDYVAEYVVGDKKIYLLGDGRLINLAAAEGHPASVMDMSFANQALSAELLYTTKAKHLEKKVYPVPEDIDKEIARLKLKSLGINIDKLSEEQAKYLESWEMGT